MAFWIIFGSLVFLIIILFFSTKVKYRRKKENYSEPKYTIGDYVGYNNKKEKKNNNSKNTTNKHSSNNNYIKKSPIGDVHLINYKHVVNKKNRVNYMSNHKGEERFVAIVGINKKNEVKIADLITIKKTHKKAIQKRQLIFLKDYSYKRKIPTGLSRRIHSKDLVTNKKYKINKIPLNNKRGKLTQNDLNNYLNKK